MVSWSESETAEWNCNVVRLVGPELCESLPFDDDWVVRDCKSQAHFLLGQWDLPDEKYEVKIGTFTWLHASIQVWTGQWSSGLAVMQDNQVMRPLKVWSVNRWSLCSFVKWINMPLMQDMGQKQLKTVRSNHDLLSISFFRNRCLLLSTYGTFLTLLTKLTKSSMMLLLAKTAMEHKEDDFAVLLTNNWPPWRADHRLHDWQWPAWVERGARLIIGNGRNTLRRHF